MKRLTKIITHVFILMSCVSSSAYAFIVEGAFSGTILEMLGENMHITPDADFFRGQDYYFENAYKPFTGTFWYDTDLAGPEIRPWDPDVVMYIAEQDWVHVTVVGTNGASIEITSRGGLPYFSKNPTDSIYVIREDYGYIYEDRFSLSYSDFAPLTAPGVDGPHRAGGLLFLANTPVLNGFGLNQNFEFSSELNNKFIGSVYLDTRGVLNGVSYDGAFWGQIHNFEIHVRNSTSLLEPSSILLLGLGLIALGLRYKRLG